MQKQDSDSSVVYKWDLDSGPYTWGGIYSCIRNGEDMIKGGERHDCYFCGNYIDFKTLPTCPNCHAVKCPTCGKCFCNGTELELMALRVLRDRYCCTEEGFSNGVQPEDFWLYHYVPAFEKCLNYCRRQKRV
jgi:hypothetical protein